ncbi:unnamed protein product [Linum tenue]|uniref:Uncharacterized protein n=1 Tax=Linum tenue TaxID=586396 RepID=A0AAV0KHP0_9ROSI|nr:unnamed protein product [Linum tenue]
MLIEIKIKIKIGIAFDDAEESAEIGVVHRGEELGLGENGGVGVDVGDGGLDCDFGNFANDGAEGENHSDVDGLRRRGGDGAVQMSGENQAVKQEWNLHGGIVGTEKPLEWRGFWKENVWWCGSVSLLFSTGSRTEGFFL